ncbi:F-box domain-containing protein [Artemisia annua]|uniref:F-box domain-containing protein n=1 Tax=Artemisia annua TaxID=35608 RepID=A0A2U1LBX1_ARTAN|nr:F-box domain-containing protein [Artemisia annua]
MAQSMVKIPSDFGNINIKHVSVVGTFNGIVLLVLEDTLLCTHMILFNPFTQVYNKVPDPPARTSVRPRQGRFYESDLHIGFGATPDDFKIVRFFEAQESLNKVKSYSCYVFSVKKSLWSKPNYFTQNFRFHNDVGMFLNGFLYWIIRVHDDTDSTKLILALDIKKIALSTINVPNRCGFCRYSNLTRYRQWKYCEAILGKVHGCLCIINLGSDGLMFNLWVMKEQGVGNSWSIAHSFRLQIVGLFLPICILDNGKILFLDMSKNKKVIIYDTSNDSNKEFIFPAMPSMTVYGTEYVQTLVSPSNMCSV